MVGCERGGTAQGMVVQGMVAGSRNEICVTRGPTSPRLAPPLLSSVRLDAVPVSAPGRVAARCVILFNYVIPVIRARRREAFPRGWEEGGRERCKGRDDRPLRPSSAVEGVEEGRWPL